MQKSYIPSCLLGAAMVSLTLAGHAADVVLSPGSALPFGSGIDPGFVVRSVQGPENPALANTLTRALRQLNGTLVDASNQPVPNEAFAGPLSDGSFSKVAVTFDGVGAPVLGFNAELFPGIPGVSNHLQNFTIESVAFLELTAGVHTFGMAVSADRTDVNDDDGYVVFSGVNPRSVFATPIGSYQRTVTQPFQSNQLNTNYFTFEAPVDGLYPFRVVYWQTGRGANLVFFSVDQNTGQILPINDPNSFDGVPAYQTATNAARANGPYIAEVSPLPGVSGIAASEPIQVLLVDGENPINDSTVKVFLNNVQVTPQSVVRTGRQLKVRYNPSATRTTVNNLIRVEFADTTGLAETNSWQFSMVAQQGVGTQVTGQWDFDSGDLAATVGSPLQYLTPTAQTGTQFGLTTDFGLPDINGQIAAVMRVPGDLDRSIGYLMPHGISPNGGGQLVNQYTLIFDIYVEPSGPGAASLLQVDSESNALGNDGDLFWQGNNFGQGGGGYNGTGQFTAGAWHRVVAAYDMAANPPVVTKYVDGIKQDDWTANQGLDAARRALKPTAVLFGDGDQDERRVMYVNSVQVRSGKLSDGEMVALGGPAAMGIPAALPKADVAGQWDFDAGDLRATAGKALQYVDPTYDGPAGSAATKTQFGTTTSFGISDINGEPANVMFVPGEGTYQLGYVMAHGISPNGGGQRVNQFTIIYDIYVETSGPGAASLLQISSTNNALGDDGDLFWQGNNFGQGGGGYNGTGQFTAGAWHRVSAAYDMAANPPVVTKYVDGIKQDDWTANQGLDAARRALLPLAVLFGDGDQDERRAMYLNSIQIRGRKMSDAELAALGGPSAAGIPVASPVSNVTGQWDFNNNSLAASVGKALDYVDPTYDGPNGSAADKTQFGTTTSFGIADIDGQPANVVRVPGDLTRQLGYIMPHGIAPNGGGQRVNQYTIIFDIYVETTGAGAASLLQTSSTNNALGDDGDLFWQGNNFGQGGGGYNGTGQFTAGAWHRVAAAYDMAATPPVVVKYVDGIFQDNWTANQGLDAVRRSLLPTAVLFGDGDQDERRVMYVNSVQIRSAPLTGAELVALGGPSATGIPIAIPGDATPRLSVSKLGSRLLILWDPSATGWTLEYTDDLNSGIWLPVDGATSNSAVVTPSGAAFYRLTK